MGNAAILSIYGIKDNKTPAFIQHFFELSDAGATRVCANLLRGDTQLSMFAEDFELYKLGEIDQNTGIVSPMYMSTYVDSGDDQRIHKQTPSPKFICGMITLKTLQERETKNDTNKSRSAASKSDSATD